MSSGPPTEAERSPDSNPADPPPPVTAVVGGVDGLVLHIRGAGPAMLWLHPYTLDSTVWFPLWRRLPGWRHIGVDLPGHGASRPMSDGEGLAGLGAAVARIARDHAVRKLIGLSFGSTVALQAAIEDPSTFNAVVLAAPAVAGAPTDPAAAIRYEQLRLMYREFGCGPHMTELWMSSPPDIFRESEKRPQLWGQLRALVSRHTWEELGGAVMASMAAETQGERALGSVTARTLVLVGEHEMPAHRESARIVAQQVPCSVTGVVGAAGHLCMLEEPDACAPLIEAHARDGTVSLPTS